MSDNVESTPNPYSAPQGELKDMSIQTGNLASLGSRFGAAFIDGIIMMIVAMVPLILFFGGWSAYVVKAAAAGVMFKVSLAIFGFLVYVVVNSYFLAANGQTVGKKLVGIKIVRTDGSTPPLPHILLRRQGPISLIQMIPFVGPLLGLIDVVMIFRGSRQCVHDQIADTCVINV
jgi:uncharacterized RDD family membrane protein YckC